MLIRFRPDVIALKPKAVVILAGTNDIAGNTGPTTLEAIEDNLMSMAELAKLNRIRVVLASVLPVCDYIKPQAQRRPPEKIEALNIWLKDYAAKNGFVYLDYYSAMIDDKKMLRQDLTYDGLHPNDMRSWRLWRRKRSFERWRHETRSPARRRVGAARRCSETAV